MLDQELRSSHPDLDLPLLSFNLDVDTKPTEKHRLSIRDLMEMLGQFSPDTATTGDEYFSAKPPANENLVLPDHISHSSHPAASSSSETPLTSTSSKEQSQPTESVLVANYLTAISANEIARSTRTWRQFSQVRADDLEANRATVSNGSEAGNVPNGVNGSGVGFSGMNGVNGFNGYHGMTGLKARPDPILSLQGIKAV